MTVANGDSLAVQGEQSDDSSNECYEDDVILFNLPIEWNLIILHGSLIGQGC